MIKIQINKICAKLIECEPLTAGMIGKTLDVEFSADWQNYTKTAVFSNGDTVIDVIESQWDGNTITIPAEVLSIAGRTVIFGMYGFVVENGTVHALPTIYAKIGIPMVGADPESDPTTNPSLPVYAQLQWEIDHFEISDEQIAEQIQEYLAEHPIEIQPATASVLGGVKVGEGLSVTADGTLSADAPDLSEYAKTEDVDELANIVDGKQDEIADLDEIRAGAALGATALQTAPVTSVNGKTGAVNLVPADLGIGSVFNLKGSKPTYADLPATGNAIGDVWYVIADSVGYIWLNDGTTDRWEQLGMEIDLSAYYTKTESDNKFAQKDDLEQYYTADETDTAIAAAIGDAIGGAF